MYDENGVFSVSHVVPFQEFDIIRAQINIVHSVAPLLKIFNNGKLKCNLR